MNDLPEEVSKCCLPNLIQLYKLIVGVRLIEFGSSSIHDQFGRACDEVREMMKTKFNIWQEGEEANVLWQRTGNYNAIFYFGGYRILDDEEKSNVMAEEYICFLCSVANELSIPTQDKFDELCGELVHLLNSEQK